MKNEGPKIGLAGMLGCLVGTVLVWHYTHHAVATIVAFPITFVASWIAYAPRQFFAVFPKAYREVSGWRPPSDIRNTAVGVFYVMLGAQGLLFWAPMLSVILAASFGLVPLEPVHPLREIGGGLIIITGTCFLLWFVVTAAILGEDNDVLEEDIPEMVWFAKRFNIITAPFGIAYYAIWAIIWLVKKLPQATLALARFLPRLIRAWAKLTASNGRLTSGCAGVLGLFICLWQNWPPVPGCLAGGMAGVTLWGSAKLALRYLPQPQRVTA